MDKNKLCRDHQLLYFHKLSPFGQKVMSTLIELKRESDDKNLNNVKPSTHRNKRVLTFNNTNTPKTPSIINETNINYSFENDQNLFHSRTNNLPSVSSSVDLLKTFDRQDDNFVNKTSVAVVEDIHVLQSLPKRLNTETTSTQNAIGELCEGISWNDFFDNEIFQNIDSRDDNFETNKILKVKCAERLLTENVRQNLFKSNDQGHGSTRECNENEDTEAEDKRKRKTLIKRDEAIKKIKSSEVKNNSTKNMFRKEKYTTAVKNWLNDVDPANAVEGDNFEMLRLQVIDKFNNAELIKKKNKKIIQAQLANKDGIMKFQKPADINEVPQSLEGDLSKEKAANIGKETQRKNKKMAKFIAPIKSQIPVRDVTFSVNIINKSNFGAYKQKLLMMNDSEIVLTLLNSNGFSQLNSHHTDDDCIPESILLNCMDSFYYLEDISGETEYLHSVFTNNTLICYDAKTLLIYSLRQLGLPIKTLTIIDVKIGTSLISPDKPPESFSEVQRLLELTPEYTVATECALQKASWYITLLRECSDKLKASLIDNGLWKVFMDIEMRILPLVSEMEHRGVLVNSEKLKSMEAMIVNRINEIEAECHRAAGKSFQINSTVQVRTILYDELQLDNKCNVKIRETICKGAKSTSEAMMRSLTNVHPLPKLILEYRHLHKAHATFLNGIGQHVKNGVVKPTWNQTAAATGRIASNNPNLQAIPKTPFNLILFPKEDDNDINKETLNFRSIYIPRPGYILLAADFKHIECRVFAHAAADSGLLAALGSPDLFRVLAAKWLNKSERDVTNEDRERTKRLIYASLYGAGPRKLMEILNLNYDQVLSIMSSFNSTYPCLKSFGRSVVSQCEKNNYRLTTASGRARTFKNIASNNFADKSHAERQAVNFIIQGTAADLCKVAMIMSSEQLRQSDPPVECHLLLQIHDELVWEVLERDLERAAAIIKHAMENCGHSCGMGLALPVAVYRGGSWGEMELFMPFDI